MMELYASGFNAYGQLVSNSNDRKYKDLTSFQKTAEGNRIRVRCAVWSATVIEVDDTLLFRGFHESGLTNAVISGLSTHLLKTVFGDMTGILGALTVNGEIWILAAQSGGLMFIKHQFSSDSYIAREGTQIDQIAIAGNDQVCISTRPFQSPSTQQPMNHTQTLDSSVTNPQLLTFPSFQSLLTSSSSPISSYPLPTPLTTLLASTTSFTTLPSPLTTPLTWGDARHLHLGRSPTVLAPASRPSPLPSLDGISIRKIATAGWLSAAVSGENDCYVWGGRPDKRERSIGAVHRREGEEEDVRLVDVEGGIDVVDVAVGDGCVLVLTAGGRVWGWGQGRWGQQGGAQRGWREGWVEVAGGWGRKEVIGIECGLWNSFVLVRKLVSQHDQVKLRAGGLSLAREEGS